MAPPRLNQLQRALLRAPGASAARLGVASGVSMAYAFGSPVLALPVAAATAGWLWVCWRPGSRRRRRVLAHYDERGFPLRP